MRWTLVLVCGCSFVPSSDVIDLSAAADMKTADDLSVTDEGAIDLPSVADQSFPDLSISYDIRQVFRDFSISIDMTTCGGPNEPCCPGTACSQSEAQAFGWFGVMCISGTCSPCGKMAEPCCGGTTCLSAPQSYNYCHSPDLICLECFGGVPC